jgi:lipoyl-dependent peroxiredoxin
VSFRVVRNAQASWQGTVEDGEGQIALSSGAFEGPYSLKARVEAVEKATNPEELLGAAEAGCYTMSLANLLSEEGHAPQELRTEARVTLEQGDGGFDITGIELRTVANVPGIDEERFAELAEDAKNCTVSRALAATKVTVEATLETG